MAQYMISVIHDWDDPDAMTADERQATYAAVEEFNQDITAAGQWVFGAGLQHPRTAKIVDGVKGNDVVTDGPYLEAKEHLGGFWIVEAASFGEAQDLARRGSEACAGVVELRPLQVEPGDVPGDAQEA